MERPGLQGLLADVRAGRIDIVVVYKVDRLTRSLADFARLIEIFDAQGVPFVSVTQQFNTTSSMGRLTLNVLLSFAQFEREVTGERTRDKIAASKQKGMWMGGNVPLGYDASDRTLAINPAEGETVRRIFGLYRELGCVRRVKQEADRLGFTTKRRTTANGTERGGLSFSRGHIYKLLSNPIYIGQIFHKGQLYPGRHPALIDAETWNAVRDQLAANASRHGSKANAVEPSLLAGVLIDGDGKRLTPSHAVRNRRRYRYYVSTALITEAGSDRAQGWRLAAREIESAVVRILIDALSSPATLFERLGATEIPSEQARKMIDRATRFAAALNRSPAERAKVVRALIEKVIVEEKTLTIKVAAKRAVGLGRATLGVRRPKRSSYRADSGSRLQAARCGNQACAARCGTRKRSLTARSHANQNGRARASLVRGARRWTRTFAP
jgi:DNA invertase Pin-like site-specific DNA recombinase